MNYDAMVIGSGVVGTATALGLAMKGFKIGIVDQSSSPPNSPRHLSVNKKSSKFLSSLKLWDEVVTSSMPYSKIQVWDREGTGRIEFSSEDINEKSLGYIIKEGNLQKVLLNRLKEYDVDFFWSEKLTKIKEDKDSLILYLNSGKKIFSKSILGADGLNSTVRKLGNFKVKSWSYDQSAIVAQIDSDRDLNGIIKQSFTKYGPLALLPINKNQMTMIWSIDQEKINDFVSLKDEEFIKVLKNEFGEKIYNPSFSSERIIFPLQHLTAIGFAKKKIALLGDAAHHVHPLAGLGLNSGLGDAECLVKLFDSYPAISAESLFKKYNNERLPTNVGLAAAMELFKRGFGNQNIWLKTFRNSVFKLVNREKDIKKIFINLATNL